MRILIVDDQLLILEGIKLMISDELSCEIITVQSAEAGINYLKNHPVPDIVISDIVMNGMDGLEFIGQVKPWLPFCNFLIFSGYDWFQFAQRAIRLGVTDYLLKPLQRNLLINTLTQLGEQSAEQQAQRSEQWLESFFMMQSGQRSSLPAVPTLPGDGSVTAAVYCVRNFAEPLETQLPGCYQVGNWSEVRLYLLVQPTDTFDAAHSRLLALTKTATVVYGISREGCIAEAMAQCAALDDNRFFTHSQPGATVDSSSLRRLDDALALTEDRRRSVSVALLSGLEEMRKLVGCPDMIRRFSRELLDRIPGASDNFDVDQEWRRAASYEAYLDSMRSCIAPWLDAAQEDTVVCRIRNYVNVHCAQPLSVKRIATAIAMSPNYVSALFKRETGESLHAYIRRKQMETAYRMICHTDMRIYEIAEMLGYVDEKYFSAIFRMTYQASPNDVRRSLRSKKDP